MGLLPAAGEAGRRSHRARHASLGPPKMATRAKAIPSVMTMATHVRAEEGSSGRGRVAAMGEPFRGTARRPPAHSKRGWPQCSRSSSQQIVAFEAGGLSEVCTNLRLSYKDSRPFVLTRHWKRLGQELNPDAVSLIEIRIIPSTNRTIRAPRHPTRSGAAHDHH